MLADRHAGTAPTAPREWRSYLLEYSDLYLRTADENERDGLDGSQVAAPWLGYEPAGEQAISAAEERLGVRFPPSFRGFLEASDGWRGVGGWIELLCSCDEIEWFRATPSGAEFIELYSEEEDNSDVVAVFERSLLIGSGEDFWLLDPAKVAADGEWAAYEFAPKYGDLEEYASFSALMDDSRELMMES